MPLLFSKSIKSLLQSRLTLNTSRLILPESPTGMKVLVIGPPGSGKGTIADKLSHIYKVPHVSTGEIFRYVIENNLPLGKEIKPLLEMGELIPCKYLISALQSRLEYCQHGFILDGCPRNHEQSRELSNHNINIDAVIAIMLNDEEVIKRLTQRLIHPASGRTYNTEFNPPKVEGKDDITGEKLERRADDNLETIKHRLEVYHSETEPLLRYYSKSMLKVNEQIQHKLILDGRQDIKELVKTCSSFIDEISRKDISNNQRRYANAI